MTDAERFPAWTAWSQLSHDERREVDRLAGRGRALTGLLLLGDVGLREWLEHRAEQRWAHRVVRALR